MREPQKYTKKPVEIEAIQYKGRGNNLQDCINFISPSAFGGMISGTIIIDTLEGPMECKPNWWIIKGLEGEFYPCKPSVFEASYDPSDETAPVSHPEPDVPGFYRYSGGNQNMIFMLDHNLKWRVWYVGWNDTLPCTWDHIEQALGVWTLERIG